LTARFSWLTTWFLMLFVPVVHAQTITITGKITDARTGEAVSFASLHLKATAIGTVTDVNGNYHLNTSRTSDTIICSVVGYQTQAKFIFDVPQQVINFEMTRVNLSLKSVVVSAGKDPAKVLFERILAHKDFNNRDKLKSYQYQVYNKVELDINNLGKHIDREKIFKPFKFIFDNVDSTSEDRPFLPFFLSETLSQYSYRRDPSGDKELIEASKLSGLNKNIMNKSLTQFLGTSYDNINVYDNYLEIFDRYFVSPVSGQGLFFYKYKIQDTAVIDGHRCFRMSFEPRRPGEATFFGDFWVVDTSFAIKRISMEVSKGANINFVSKITLYQEYEPLGDTVWMLAKDKFVVDFVPTQMKTVLGLIARKTTTYSNFVVNNPMIDTCFKEKEELQVESNVMDHNEDYWNKVRNDSLSKSEKLIYKNADSVQKVPLFRTYVSIFNFLTTGYYVNGLFEFGSYFNLVSVNDDEGTRVRIGARTSDKMSTHNMLTGYVAAGNQDDRSLKYGLSDEYIFHRDPRTYIQADFINDLDIAYPTQADYVSQDNLIEGLFYRNITQKLTNVKMMSLFYHKEWKTGFSAQFTIDNKVMTPETYYLYFTPPDGETFNYYHTPFTTTEASVTMRFAYQEKFIEGDFLRVSLGSKYPIAALTYTYGMPGVLGSNFQYHKLDLDVYNSFDINPLGTLNYEIKAGKTFGTLPFYLLDIPQGNDTYIFDDYSFNGMQLFEFATDQYVSAYITHHFNGLFLNEIPLMRKLKWREIIFFRGVIGDLTPANRAASMGNNLLVPYPDPYAETGVGIENIFKIFRVDVFKRLTYLNSPLATPYGVRVGFQLIL
jgi:hypothetical protein